MDRKKLFERFLEAFRSREKRDKFDHESSNESLGSNSEESESPGVDEQTEDVNVNAPIANSNHSHLSSPLSSNPNNTNNIASAPNQTPPDTSIDMPNDMAGPMIHPHQSQHEDTKISFIVHAVELLGALSNSAANSKSPREKAQQILIYAVVTSCTFAFLLSSAALLLRTKRPEAAKIMQNAAFLFGAFGFMGILGMLLPATIMWLFAISAFLLCLFVFIVANLM